MDQLLKAIAALHTDTKRNINSPTIPPNSETKHDHEPAYLRNIPRPSSNKYYNWCAPNYARSPDQVARAAWLKSLIEEHKAWLGLDETKPKAKALDYAAGTGFVSCALAPYVTKTIGVDTALNMTIVYNETVKELRRTYPSCEMRALWGHIVDREGEEDIGRHISEKGVCKDFDLIAMCLAIDLFGAENDTAALQAGLKTLVNRLNEGGSILIIEIEKDCASDAAASSGDTLNPNLKGGRKKDGHGSREVVAALEDLGLKDIAVRNDLQFRSEFNLLGQSMVREEWYFMVKATKAEKSTQLGIIDSSKWTNVD